MIRILWRDCSHRYPDITASPINPPREYVPSTATAVSNIDPRSPSRISRDRVRKIRFFQPAAYLSIDYAAQKIEVWRLVKGEGTVL